ncbi:MAG: VWA domain-containing protein [Polyangiaceae bacterium]|nr:VWA domain-containing protein [Polyangiaceae bacterium]
MSQNENDDPEARETVITPVPDESGASDNLPTVVDRSEEEADRPTKPYSPDAAAQAELQAAQTEKAANGDAPPSATEKAPENADVPGDPEPDESVHNGVHNASADREPPDVGSSPPRDFEPPPESEPPSPRPPPSPFWERIVPALAAILAIVVTVWIVASGRQAPGLGLSPTIADLQAVHAGVSLRGAPVRGVVRVTAKDTIETAADGRGRIRLDDGTQIVIDRSTKITLDVGSVAIESGRIFVIGSPSSRTEIDLGGAKALVTNVTAAVDRRNAAAPKVYAPNEDLTIRDASGADVPLRGGFTATIEGGKAKIQPEKSFDDWTFGMAAPWSVNGPPRRTVAELWARVGTSEAAEQITVRSHEVRATIRGESAKTQVSTTFFNAGSSPVTGDYRLALPPGAIVSRFAINRGSYDQECTLSLAERDRVAVNSGRAVLEWAGEGWVRGTIPSIPSGATIKVVLEYTEWLVARPKTGSQNIVVQYRYPMAADSAPPQIGDFYARIDASGSAPISVASGLGANVSGGIAELRKPDFRPTADLVVDVEIAPWRAPAQLYLAPPAPDDDAGATILVRTPAPASQSESPAGVSLALVLDTSQSVDPALFEAERALVGAVVSGLGANDKVIVIAADQTARAVGPDKLGPADEARKKAILDALTRVTTGGATDIGRAFEAGADALPPNAPAAMVVYVGDGWPTVGDSSPDRIIARLARRTGGAPRLGAALVGPLVNRLGMAALVRGQGPVLEVRDTTDAAHTAVALLADALQPTIAGVELDFASEVERVYPRGARAIVAGSTIFALGRVRGRVPDSVIVRWRDESGPHEERRLIVAEEPLDPADITRRWASARIDEIALRTGSRETAADVAFRAGVLSPWTGFADGGRVYTATPFGTRMLDLGAGPGGGFGAVFGTSRARGTIASTTQAPDFFDEPDEGDDAYKALVARAAARMLLEASAEIRACRDARAAVRPEIGDEFQIGLKVDGSGAAGDVRVRGTINDDEQLDRCVQIVVQALHFPASELSVSIDVSQIVRLAPFRTSMRGRSCSSVSTLPLPARRGVWRERLSSGVGVSTAYLAAKMSCELPTWTDQRTFLEIVLDVVTDGGTRVRVASDLEAAGEAAAAKLIVREALRRAATPYDLQRVTSALLAGERLPVGAFRKQYQKASDDSGRLAVVRRFLTIAPHDARLRRTLLLLLESLSKKDELIEQARIYRQDPFTDAVLLADIAAILRRAGEEAEARRAYGELSERAPDDPWARAFLGDRLRNEGWFDDATLAYEALEDLLPGDAATGVRLALAHAGSTRLDVAQRMLARVAQTGGRAGDVSLGEIGGYVAHALLAENAAKQGVSDTDRDRLIRTALALPFPDSGAVVLVRGPAGSVPLNVSLVRGPKEAPETRAPDLSAPSIGLMAMRMGASDTNVVVKIARPLALSPARPVRVRVDALIPAGAGKPPTLVSTEIELLPDGKPVSVRLQDGALSKE